jgi:hypothetical protein
MLKIENSEFADWSDRYLEGKKKETQDKLEWLWLGHMDKWNRDFLRWGRLRKKVGLERFKMISWHYIRNA